MGFGRAFHAACLESRAPTPDAGVAVTAGFEFDLPVRFDTDSFAAAVLCELAASTAMILTAWRTLSGDGEPLHGRRRQPAVPLD